MQVQKVLSKMYHSIFDKKRNKIPAERIKLPQDAAFLPDEKFQWWYWTGHLKTSEGKEFGFEVVFFAVKFFSIFKIQVVQVGITDVEAGHFTCRQHFKYFSIPKKLDGKFDLKINKHHKEVASAMGGDGTDNISCEVEDYRLELLLEATQDPVLHYAGYPYEYVCGGYTYYYSRERMKANGKLTHKETVYEVEGVTWFDRQYGDLLPLVSQGYQWFAIELHDNTSIMLFEFLDEKYQDDSYASVTIGNNTKVLLKDEWSTLILDGWETKHTHIRYPSGWRVTLGGKVMYVEPKVKDQQMGTDHHLWLGWKYWEGTCYVKDTDGNVIGDAYVELDGFRKGVVELETINGREKFGKF